MKRFLMASAIVAALFSSASADDLSSEDTTWLVKFMGAHYVANNCGPFEMDYAGARRWGDQNAADVEHLVKAFLAAVGSFSGDDYSKADIDPKVTRVVLKFVQSMEVMEKSKSKSGLCSQLSSFALRDGFIKKK